MDQVPSSCSSEQIVDLLGWISAVLRVIVCGDSGQRQEQGAQKTLKDKAVRTGVLLFACTPNFVGIFAAKFTFVPNKTRPVSATKLISGIYGLSASAALCLCKGLGEISNWLRITKSK
eukprot:g15818.t1